MLRAFTFFCTLLCSTFRCTIQITYHRCNIGTREGICFSLETRVSAEIIKHVEACFLQKLKRTDSISVAGKRKREREGLYTNSRKRIDAVLSGWSRNLHDCRAFFLAAIIGHPLTVGNERAIRSRRLSIYSLFMAMAKRAACKWQLRRSSSTRVLSCGSPEIIPCARVSREICFGWE